MEQIRPIPDLSRTRKINIPVNTRKTNNRKLEDEYIKKGSTGPGARERFAILTKEYETENDCNNIKYLNKRLKDNSLNLAEYNKISDDIDKIKKNIPKKEQELHELKKDLEKSTRTDQAKSFKDQNKELSGLGA